jgi:hypothetical protein
MADSNVIVTRSGKRIPKPRIIEEARKIAAQVNKVAVDDLADLLGALSVQEQQVVAAQVPEIETLFRGMGLGQGGGRRKSRRQQRRHRNKSRRNKSRRN